jgi:hypothetical protein
MTRPLRIEFDGALYDVTSRGDRKEAIYDYTRDLEQFLGEGGQVSNCGTLTLTRFDVPILAVLPHTSFE